MEQQEERRPDFYQTAYTLEEIADIIDKAMDDDLEGELVITRVTIRRVAENLRAELEPGEFARLAPLIFKGSSAVANILRARRAISGEAAHGIVGFMAQAIQELKNEMDWKI